MCKIYPKIIIFLSFAVLMMCCGCGKDESINVRQEEISVPGLTKEHKIIFLSDSHISMCDERDADVLEKAKSREASFSADGILPQDRFRSLIKYAKKSDCETVILGGDILDSAMYASIEYVDGELSTLPMQYLFLMGNHDFEYGSEYFSENAYNTYLPRLDKMRSNTSYQIYETDDIIYFTVDDGCNRISSEALEAYKSITDKGKPIIVATHIPIEPVTGDTSLTNECINVWGATDTGKSKVTYGPNGLTGDPVTMEFVDLVTSQDSPVVLVLAGHIHFYHKDMLNDHTLQIVSGAAYEGEAIEIVLK